jgi:uncharacterized DUF497 family protein
MEITFDPAKREATLAHRGLDFADAAKVFSGRTFTQEDARFAYPELRFVTAGDMDGRLVVLVWTPTDNGRRIISMRHAHDREERYWRERMD